jgi:hypothetical protein
MNVDDKINDLIADLDHAEHQFPHIHGDCNLTHFSYCFPHVELSGLWLEFGVFRGGSIGTIASCNPNQTIYGFDSFDGLPEDWNKNNPKGKFSLGGVVPDRIFRGLNVIHGEQYKDWDSNIVLVKGLFEDTLPPFVAEHPENVAFMHIDSDLYSSAKTIFGELKDRIIPGTVICFDDWCGYPNNPHRDEVKAFAEFLLGTGLGCGPPLSHQTDLNYSQVGYKLK